MNLRNWLASSVSDIRQQGLRQGGRGAARDVYLKGLRTVSAMRDPGTPVYDREWDLLVVLDACRYDLMCEVAGDYEFVADVGRYRSLDSTTSLWMRKNFVADYADEMSDTIYVCGNPFSADELDPNDFRTLDEVWRYVWEDPGTVPPEAITDRTIRAARDGDADRVVAHYMQPHCPFLSAPDLTRGKVLEEFGDQQWRDVWGKLRDGEVSKERVWESYRENLRLGMDEVEVLLENVDAERAVVTSDHGNAAGEWRVYGHPPGMPMDCLRVVPWIETSATDRGTRDPQWTVESGVEQSRSEQLAALGYT